MRRKLLQKLGRGADAKLTLAGAGLLVIAAFLGASLIDFDGPSTPDEDSKQDAKLALTESAALPIGAKASDSKPKTSPLRQRKSLRPPRATNVASPGRLITGFLIVLCLGVGGILFGRKFLKRVRMTPQGKRILSVVDAIPLGGKRQIYVVEVYGRRIVVGATADSLSVLSEFEACDLELGDAADAATNNTVVAAKTERIAASKVRAPKTAVGAGDLPNDFKQMLERQSRNTTSIEIEA
ncbi:MAG: flagellar biosynthetic protein FliO [Planctomycetota bacterium]